MDTGLLSMSMYLVTELKSREEFEGKSTSKPIRRTIYSCEAFPTAHGKVVANTKEQFKTDNHFADGSEGYTDGARTDLFAEAAQISVNMR